LFHEHFIDRAIWYKGHGNPAMAANVMASRFEDIWIWSNKKGATRAIPTASFRGTVENVIECGSASSENESAGNHAATMPIKVCAYAIQSFSPAQGSIYEPFSGSGTTIIACEQLGRKCRAMEISPAYVAVALQRFKDATGKTPRLLNV
jgi:DNA modification methylase